MVSEETALKIFPVWLASVLNSMWRTKDPIVVGGSFIPYVLGYLTWYNDIDIFLAASYFPKFLSLFKDETKIIIMADYSEFDGDKEGGRHITIPSGWVQTITYLKGDYKEKQNEHG